MENSKNQNSFFLRGKKQSGNNFNNKVQPQDSAGNSQNFEAETQRTFKGKRQGKFDDSGTVQHVHSGDKKPFDKKTYRLKKYSKKYKLEQWEEQRKKRLLRNLEKDLKADEGAGTYRPKTFDEDAADGQDVTGRFVTGRFVKHPDLIEKENVDREKWEKERKRPGLSARERHEKLKQDKLEKQQQVQKAIEDKRKKMQEYKKKKQEKFKKLSMKTKKGQPVMTGRLELLLEKIQKNK